MVILAAMKGRKKEENPLYGYISCHERMKERIKLPLWLY